MVSVFKREMLEREVIKPTYQQHFHRYEFKYILSHDLRLKVESELTNFLHFDPYVAARRNQKYSVRSLYFEDPHYSSYYEKIDGMMHRTKFRLRTYSRKADDTAEVFLELKGRKNLRVFKHRVRLAQLSAADFNISGSDVSSLILQARDDNPLFQQFHYELLRKQLRPIMLIDYERRPYITRYSQDFRLTFDDGLISTSTDSLFPSPAISSRAVLRGFTIMEVKFAHAIPFWFHRIVRSYNLNRVSVSKVCKGIDAWKLTPNLE